jgi:zinc transport system substrate-binding protein
MSLGISLINGVEDESEHEEEHEGEQHAEESHDHSGVDPHTWVSPKSALVLAKNVLNSLIEADAANQADYEKNYEALKQKLEAIDAEYAEQLSQTKNKNIVVSHQAFGYLARDYGLNQVPIMGLSPEAEPRAQDLLDIAKFVKENDVKYIFFEELVSDQLARTLASEADVETMVLNPLEGLTSEQEAAGDNYLTLMERNLQNLVQALQ